MAGTTTQQPAPQQAVAAQGAVAVQAPSQNNTLMKRMQEETVTNVLDRVTAMQNAGELVLPKDYHAGNALKSAWLYLQTIADKTGAKAIDKCTKESICNCLLDMVIKGEHPKQHCYFIPCGNSLEFWERYTGRYMRAKRDTEIEKVNAQVIYEGDVFTYTVDENGQYQFVSHQTDMGNIDIAKIKGAYAVVINKDGSRHLEVMTLDQIRKAWGQGAARGNSMAHVNFTDQMCKKTIISRACKIALDSTSDGEQDDTDRMTPPDASEVEREQAQHQLPKGTTSGQNFEAAAEYEEVTDPVPANDAAPAPQVAAPTAQKRECPI
jgi:recombination protein RecT